MKGLLFQQQQQQQQQHQHQAVDENMSNLTSASGEASVSSGNRTEIGTNYPQYFAPPPQSSQPPKKKRNLPGNPGKQIINITRILIIIFCIWFTDFY